MRGVSKPPSKEEMHDMVLVLRGRLMVKEYRARHVKTETNTQGRIFTVLVWALQHGYIDIKSKQ